MPALYVGGLVLATLVCYHGSVDSKEVQLFDSWASQHNVCFEIKKWASPHNDDAREVRLFLKHILWNDDGPYNPQGGFEMTADLYPHELNGPDWESAIKRLKENFIEWCQGDKITHLTLGDLAIDAPGMNWVAQQRVKLQASKATEEDMTVEIDLI